MPLGNWQPYQLVWRSRKEEGGSRQLRIVVPLRHYLGLRKPPLQPMLPILYLYHSRQKKLKAKALTLGTGSHRSCFSLNYFAVGWAPWSIPIAQDDPTGQAMGNSRGGYTHGRASLRQKASGARTAQPGRPAKGMRPPVSRKAEWKGQNDHLTNPMQRLCQSLSFTLSIARKKDYASIVWSLSGKRLLEAHCKAQTHPGERKDTANLILSKV